MPVEHLVLRELLITGCTVREHGQRTVIVEHPYHSGRELVEPVKFEEKTPSLYRFRVPVEAGKTDSFVVKEKQTRYQGVVILNESTNTLLYYARIGKVSEIKCKECEFVGMEALK